MLGFKSFRSIRTKLLVSVLSASAIGLVGLSLFLILRFGGIQDQQIDEWIHSDARANAGIIEGRLNQLLAESRGYANAALPLANLDDSVKAEMLSKLAAQALSIPTVKASYYMFDSTGFLDASLLQPGQVYSYSFYNGPNGSPQSDGVGPYSIAADEDYYWLPYRSGKESIIEPYKWLYDGTTDTAMMISLCVPIKKDGRTIGIFGIDITLEDLYKELLAPLKPGGTGYTILVSNKGLRAGHAKKEILLTTIGDDVPGEKQQSLLQAVAQGKMHSLDKIAKATGAMSRIQLAPVVIGQTETPWSLISVYPLNLVKESSRKVRTEAWILVVVVLLALASALWYLGNQITKPVLKTAATMNEIAQGDGDLTVEITVETKDELAQLASGFNTFVHKMRVMVEQVKGGVHTLASSAEELNATSVQTSSLAEEMHSQSQNIERSVTDSSQRTRQMANSAEALSGSMTSASAAVEEMSVSLQEVAQNCEREFQIANQASQQAVEVKTTVDRLASAAQEVENVLDLINDIAEQINLLALNATIEAASAGEAGKGFAVVAGEVKELAKQTATATGRIAGQIAGMQKALSESVKSIETIANTIEEVNDVSRTIVAAVEEQSVTIRSIAQNVAMSTTEAHSINRDSGEISEFMQAIAHNMQGLSQVTQETSRSSQAIMDSSRGLSALGAQQQNMVGRFKT